MTFSISARGWDPTSDRLVAPILSNAGIKHLETSPGKMIDAFGRPSALKAEEYRQFWADYGIEVVAMQSLFFGQPQLSLFKGLSLFNETVDYFKWLIEIGEKLGISYFVLGAYQSRIKGNLQESEANSIFVEFLEQISDSLKGSSMHCLIEPVPKQYGADYLINHNDVLTIVNLANRPNIGLLLDLGAYYTNQETAIEKYAASAKHLHIAVPGFGRVDQFQGFPYQQYAKLLSNTYNGLVSIEMFEQAFQGHIEDEMVEMLNYLATLYL